MNAIVAWWYGITARERWMVAGVSAVLLVTIVWLAIVEPLERRRATLESDVPAQRELLAWVRSTAGRLREDGAAPEAGGQSLFAAVDRSVRTTALAGAVQRLQPEGQDSVRLWLEDAPFDDLVRWLAELEARQGISPSAIAIERTDTAGHVDARVTLVSPVR